MSHWPGAQKALNQGRAAMCACHGQGVASSAPASCCPLHAGHLCSLPPPSLTSAHEAKFWMALDVPYQLPSMPLGPQGHSKASPLMCVGCASPTHEGLARGSGKPSGFGHG